MAIGATRRESLGNAAEAVPSPVPIDPIPDGDLRRQHAVASVRDRATALLLVKTGLRAPAALLLRRRLSA